jgi:hypothetical protein
MEPASTGKLVFSTGTETRLYLTSTRHDEKKVLSTPFEPSACSVIVSGYSGPTCNVGWCNYSTVSADKSSGEPSKHTLPWPAISIDSVTRLIPHLLDLILITVCQLAFFPTDIFIKHGFDKCS